jgi:hypothetical protein
MVDRSLLHADAPWFDAASSFILAFRLVRCPHRPAAITVITVIAGLVLIRRR